MTSRPPLLSAFGAILLAGTLVACSGGTGSTTSASKPAATTSSKPAATAVSKSGESAPKPGQAGNPQAGKQAIVAKGCIACHTIPGIPEAKGTVGPNLAGFASLQQIAGVLPNNPDNLRRWLMNPPAVKPGTAMPNLNLTPQEVTDISAYLETLK